MSCTRIITLALISLELFPFDHFPYKISCPLYNLKTVRDISMKLGTLIKQNDRICDAQEPYLLLAYFVHAHRKGETSVF